MKEKRVTQQDVAKAAGVHRTTVSLSFKRHPSIPEDTRERVLKIAKKMGYCPDPMLSALASYRSGLQTRPYQGTLAWLLIDSHLLPMDWHDLIYHTYFLGAEEQAKEYGYNIEVFDYNTNEMSAKRMASILRARNVNGILLSPQSLPHTVREFVWNDFSFISFGYTLSSPKLHLVTAAQYRSTLRLLDKMHQVGYRRIAFAFDATHDARVDHNFLAGYLTFQHTNGMTPLIYPYSWLPKTMDSFLDFYRVNKPDAVITGDINLVRYIRELGLRVPEDIGVGSPVVGSRAYGITGFDENNREIGATAVNRLVNMIFRGEKGIPSEAQCTLVDGIWVEGETL